MTGEAYDAAVANLMAMGFEREQVIRALHASFNNPERAAEYLFSVSHPMLKLTKSGVYTLPISSILSSTVIRINFVYKYLKNENFCYKNFLLARACCTHNHDPMDTELLCERLYHVHRLYEQ